MRTHGFDVAVVGLGGMGSAAAFHLAARGARVLGLEQFTPAHARGSSHGGSRIIRQAYFEDPAYVPLLLRSYDLFDALAKDSRTAVINTPGGLMIGAPDSVTVAGSRRSAEIWGLRHEMLDAGEIHRRFPTFTPAAGEVALFEAKAGYVRPEATVSAHLELAERFGADLRFQEVVLGYENAAGGGVRITTASGVHHADRVVVTPGAWAPALLADLGVPFAVERQVQHWFEPIGGVAGWQPGQQPVWIWSGDTDPTMQAYGFPALGDGGVKCAFFRRGRLTGADTLDRAVRPEEHEELAAWLRPRLPRLAGVPLRGVACMYTNTPDLHFVIGPHPEHPDVTVAAGFSGHGFKFVPVVGEILADLALTGATTHPIELFAPTRQFAGKDGDGGAVGVPGGGPGGDRLGSSLSEGQPR